MTKKIPHKKERGEKHERDYTLDIIKAIGITPAFTDLYIPIKRETQDRLDGILCGYGVRPGDRLIAIHPSGSCPSKRWLPERFARVSDRLVEEENAKIVLIAGADGAVHTDRTKKSMRHDIIDFSRKTTVSELASLLKRCSLFISNDSGPVHVASAVGTPSIVLFGRKDAGLGPIRWGPTGKYDIILHKDAGCTRCLAHNCEKGFSCLRAIDEDEVIEAAKGILNKTGGVS